MEAATNFLPALQNMSYAIPAAVAGLVFFVLFYERVISPHNTNKLGLPSVPEVPGWCWFCGSPTLLK